MRGWRPRWAAAVSCPKPSPSQPARAARETANNPQSLSSPSLRQSRQTLQDQGREHLARIACDRPKPYRGRCERIGPRPGRNSTLRSRHGLSSPDRTHWIGNRFVARRQGLTARPARSPARRQRLGDQRWIHEGSLRDLDPPSFAACRFDSVIDGTDERRDLGHRPIEVF